VQVEGAGLRDLDDQCLRFGTVGDVVVLLEFWVMAKKAVTGMRGQVSESERCYFCFYLMSTCALSSKK